MSANGNGYYVISLWGSAGGVDVAALRSYVKATYGDDYITGLGTSATGVNFGALQSQFQSQIDDGASATNPTMADLNTGVIKVGGQGTSVLQAIKDVASDDATAVGNAAVTVASGLLTGLKVLAAVVIVAGVAYILYNTGALKNVVKRT